MIRYFILSALLLTSVIGCELERSQPRADSMGTRVLATQTPVAHTLATPADDDGCQADSTPMHADPHRLVNEYLDHGGRGDFLASDPWHDGAVECPGHTPGFDSGILVTGWRVSTLRETRDTVVVQVEFDRHSQITQDSVGMYLAPASSRETDTVTVVRKPYGWRVGGYEFAPHVLPTGVKTHLKLREGDVQVVDSLIAGAAVSRPGA